MDTKLFRKEALAEFFNPDARGTLLTIAPPWSLAVFGVMALLCIALALLASMGRVHIYAEGRGVVRPSEPPIAMHAPFAGTVVSVAKNAGSRGRAGELLIALDAHADSEALAKSSRELQTEEGDLAALEARLRDWNDAAGHDHDASLALVLIAQIRAERDKVNGISQRVDVLQKTVERSRIVLPVDASVDDIAVSAGSQVHEGDVVATLVPADARLIGYLSLPERYRSELAQGKAVRLKFDALPYDDVGVGTGKVTRVLDALPSGIKTDAPDSSGVCAEVDILAMPGSGATPRKGMTFTGEVLSREARVSAVLFGSPDTGE
jgi:multidrug resistance efflux pump